MIYIIDTLTNINTCKIEFLIVYTFDDSSTCLNYWQDKYYLIKIFLTLFLFKNNRYLAKNKFAISLKIWVKYTMKIFNC